MLDLVPVFVGVSPACYKNLISFSLFPNTRQPFIAVFTGRQKSLVR